MNQFPSAVIGLIFSLPATSCLVIRLWKCGDRLLNHKLAQSVTYVHLTGICETPCKWPRLVSNLRSLRYFGIESQENVFSDKIPASQALKDLSPSLQTLHICVPDFLDCFLNRSLDSTTSCISTTYDRGSSSWINLDLLFPRLTSLQIGDARSSEPHETTLLVSELAALPASLTHLSLQCRNIKYDNPLGLLYSLPRSLRILNLAMEIMFLYDWPSAQDWLAAPPNLTSIDKLQWNCNIYVPLALPRTLSEGNVTLQRWSASRLAELPKSLEKLCLTACSTVTSEIEDFQWLSELPTALRSLEFGIGFDSAHFDLASVCLLPRNLTSIHFGQPDFDWAALQTAARKSLWPPSLSKISFSLHKELKSELWTLLPQSTTDITAWIWYTGPIESISANQLPPHLKSFALNSLGDDLRLEKDALPSLLERFSYTRIHETSQKGVFASFAEIPTSLVSLSLDVGETDFPLLSSISEFTRLTELDLDLWPCVRLPLLPRSLTSVTIMKLVGSNEEWPEPLHSAFVNLPSRLESLEIELATELFSLSFSEHSFNSLPMIRSLAVHESVNWFPSLILRHLPREMQCLRLSFNHLETENIPYIPPHLTEFDPCCDIDWSEPSLVRFWPWKERFLLNCPEEVSDAIDQRIWNIAH